MLNLTQYKTEYTNFLPLFTDLELDPKTDMLWLLHHNERTSLNDLKSKPIWKSRKNIFLIDCENLTSLDDDILKNDSRIHAWTPCVSENCYTYHFWFDWMQEIEKYLVNIKNLKDCRQKKYMFDSLLGTSRFHKDLVYNFILSSNQKNNFLISYNGNPLNPETKEWILGTSDEVFREKIIYNKVQGANPTCVIPYKIYNQCWYSLVAETSGEQPNFYTEKTGKPLISKRVFVMFAGRHHLKNLKQFGFKTFDGIIDESYDNISDLKTRYQQAWKQIEFLLEQDPFEIYKQAESILEHNYNHFMNTDWKKDMHKKIQNISHLSK